MYPRIAPRSAKRDATLPEPIPIRTMKMLQMVSTQLLILCALPIAAEAYAQSTQPDDTVRVQPRWTQSFDQQLQKLLSTDDRERVDKAMQLIMHFERNEDIHIDLTPVIPCLFRIYESESYDDGRRLLALATLEAIGGNLVMQRLAERLRSGRERSKRVEKQTLRVLAARMQARDATRR